MWGDVVDPDIFEDIKTRGSGLATFVVKTMHRSRFLYMNYIFCKFLNVANVVANMMFINYYLEDAFFKYGWGAIKHFQTNLYDGSDPIQEVTFKIHANCIDLLLMSQLIWKQVFPFVTKCDFKQYFVREHLFGVDFSDQCFLSLTTTSGSSRGRGRGDIM